MERKTKGNDMSRKKENCIYTKDMTFADIISRLKAGEVIYDKDDDTVSCYMVDGVIVYIDKVYGVRYINNDLKISDHSYYFKTSVPLEIKIGNLYKTRDGKKAFVGKRFTDGSFGGYIAEGSVSSWCVCGKHEATGSSDLVAKWND